MMQKERLNAFSDGVLAIIITIMVLELKVPHGADWNALSALWPVFFSYVLSFVFVGIYWNNHHHLMHACHGINASIMWANMHLLFWLSLIPFATGWMGENHFAPLPVAVYGVALLMPGIAYNILQLAIVRANGPDKTLANALGRDFKGKLSPIFCIAGAGLAFVDPRMSCVLYVALAMMWLIPDRRIEKTVGHG
jgi:uncharacterized membrane protein